MPRYFIDMTDGDRTLRDEEGEDFADVEAAKRSAIASLPGPADGDLPDGKPLNYSAIVRSEGGAALYIARLTFHGEWIAGSRLDALAPGGDAPWRRGLAGDRLRHQP